MTKLLLALALAVTPLAPFSAFSAEPIQIPKVKPGEPLPADLFVQLAKAVNPAVVNIGTSYTPRARGGGPTNDPLFEMFEQFMGPNPYGGRPMPQQSLGTGFIIREDGLILTNNHVIDHADVIKVQITENTKEEFTAKLIGKDPRTDVALIKIDAKRKLPFVNLGSSANVQVGEWVAAFGDPYGYGHTMTKGIISAVGREIDELNNIAPFLQTDASINPGNSGGPLVNTKGEVIAVNTAIDARGQGIGFAIPIDNVKAVLPQLEKEGGVKRAFLGVEMADIEKDAAKQLHLKQTEGALIVSVLQGSAAQKAGVEPYDLVIEFGGKPVKSTRELSKAVIAAQVGADTSLKVIRNGNTKSLNIHLGSEELMAKAAPKAEREKGGQEAPFGLGFSITEYNRRTVVVAVQSGSPAQQAGMSPGDVILDVNRISTSHAKDVFKNLKKGTINILRILKQDRVVLISMRAN